MKRIVVGLTALVGLVLLLVGLPLLLVAVAPLALPGGGWSATAVWAALSRPDDGHLALLLFLVAGWVAWGILALATLVDLASRLRHVSVPRLPGLALPQVAVGRLISAIAALFVVTATLTSTGTPAAVADPGAPPAPAKAATPLHAPQEGGRHTSVRTVTVHRGDTLSQIALDTTGKASNYPALFEASRHTRQPGGRHLSDPDLILPGWTITIPGQHRPTQHTTDQVNTSPVTNPTTIPDRDPAPSSPATAAASPQAPADTHTDADAPVVEEAAWPGWMLGGLAGAGALLAGGLWLGLKTRRAAQFRSRRPGRTITAPPATLAPVEKTLIHQGAPTGVLVSVLDETLRRLAGARLAAGQPLPTLLGVDLTADQLTLRLADPCDLAGPWQAADDDQRTWRLTHDTDPDLIGPLEADSPAPWPQLVTLGADAHGWRLVNLERLGVVSLTGDPLFAEDLARYLVAELAVSPWSADVAIDCLQVCPELPGLAPDRLRYHDQPGTLTADQVSFAVATIDRLAEVPAALEDARATQAGEHTWDSHLLVSALTDLDHLDVLTGLISEQTGRTGTAVLLTDPGQPPTGVELRLTPHGRLHVPSLGLDLVVNGLTLAEAHGCVALLAAGAHLDDAPVPAMTVTDDSPEWVDYCDESGSLLETYTVPRGADVAATSSLLPEPDDTYVAVTANTAEDVATLAPQVPLHVTDRIEAADPTLEEDLAAWWSPSCDRPRLQVLGPVKVRVGPSGDPTKAAARQGFYTEIVAYLSTRPTGATSDEVADAFALTTARVRRDMTVVRAWLGPNPATGTPWLPEAMKHPGADERGAGLYGIDGLLTDADLFRRLRLRGEARGGTDGLADLRTALRLVHGAPFDDLRARGGLWLADSRLDQHLLVGIVDVAHLVATISLADGDHTQARAAAELAALIAPDEATPKLDMAAVAAHEGHPDTAATIARTVVSRRHPHADPLGQTARTDAILRTHRWLEQAS